MMSQEPDKEQVKEKVANDVEEAVEQAQQEVARSRVPWYSASKRTQLLVLVCLIFFVLFGLLAWYVHLHPVIAIDVAITQEFQEHHLPWLLTLMEFVSLLGNYPLIFSLLLLLTAIVFWMVRLRLEGLYFVVLSAISELVNTSVKLLINRPRPAASLVEVLQTAPGQSFPSGHVMSYIAYWGLLFALSFILFKRDRWWHYALLIISAFFVIMIGPSRIYLGDHWASDVLGAYILGGLLLGVSLWIYLSLKQRGVLEEKGDDQAGSAVRDRPQRQTQHVQ
jgi:membrane-associated phospholipid phosphatase